MKVKDGYKLSFYGDFGDGQEQELAAGIDASPYVPWGMGYRFGMVAKGTSGMVNFSEFSLAGSD
jgi:hypothetical protein